MFLFLSKFLPLFVYPLGLTCLLTIAALVLMWKRPRWAAIALSVALTVLVLAGNGWVSSALARSLERQHLPAAEVPTAQAIVILGGATRSPEPPRPWVEVNEAGDRLLYGAKLYREGKAPVVILSGGRIDWQGPGPSESEDMAVLLEPMGVPASAILQDPTSLNTRENAVNVKRILEEKGIRQILLVTSAMHMPRSVLIFQRLGIDPIPAPTDFLTDDLGEIVTGWQDVVLNLVPDADSLYLSTRAMKEYIGIIIYRLRGWA
ncbi:MAG TPA: YdcF family protein [Oscillatoriales cyanobacterium M59_W2019_021]|nr:MAG: YdcF family protein [Cyanobacteria bacterium J055]HIK30550.1 YdcF family protein [Oscillatoriales cyanobacterium M4454_W2019_049]HIK50495.1 YdcF family protein [Oscillatoriales cyanobacterium M59_W2019_021]